MKVRRLAGRTALQKEYENKLRELERRHRGGDDRRASE